MTIVARLFTGAPYRRRADPETRARQDRRIVRNRVISVAMAATAAFALSGCASETVEVREGFYGSLARSEEHTSELQSLMRISYAVFCLQKKNSCLKLCR